MFKDKTLLITGGTGSFGNAVMKRFLHTDVKEIRVFSRDEKKQDDMRKVYKDDKLKFYNVGKLEVFFTLEVIFNYTNINFTDKQKARCSEYGIDINSLLEGFKDYAAANGKQYVDWSRAFNTWINNHITWNKLKPVNQNQLGGNYEQPKELNKFEQYINNYGSNSEIKTVYPDESAADATGHEVRTWDI